MPSSTRKQQENAPSPGLRSCAVTLDRVVGDVGPSFPHGSMLVDADASAAVKHTDLLDESTRTLAEWSEIRSDMFFRRILRESAFAFVIGGPNSLLTTGMARCRARTHGQ